MFKKLPSRAQEIFIGLSLSDGIIRLSLFALLYTSLGAAFFFFGFPIFDRDTWATIGNYSLLALFVYLNVKAFEHLGISRSFMSMLAIVLLSLLEKDLFLVSEGVLIVGFTMGAQLGGWKFLLSSAIGLTSCFALFSLMALRGKVYRVICEKTD